VSVPEMCLGNCEGSTLSFAPLLGAGREYHGQNDNAAAVSVVSRELENVLTEAKNCQGFKTDKANYMEDAA
jgi:hypothetical protein